MVFQAFAEKFHRETIEAALAAVNSEVYRSYLKVQTVDGT